MADDKLKVLHLGKFYPPAKGGMETIVKLICDHTSSVADNRVLVVNHTNERQRDERDGATGVIRVPEAARIGAVAVAPTLPVALAREQADLIVLHEPNPMGLLAYFLARPAARLIVWFHSEVIRPSWRYQLFYRPFLDFALRRASRIVVSSPTLAASSEQLRLWRSKCTIIPFGLSVKHDSAAVARRAEAIRAEHSRPIVLFVGRLVPYKGADVLLEAMRGIAASAILVGDGPLRAHLESKARDLGVSDRVRFCGEVADDELAALYAACDFFVLPSITRQEAFGVVQLEAMGRGKPVISTSLGTGVDWVNQHGETGLVIRPHDAEALHEAIQQLVTDPARRVVLGTGAAKRATTVFTVERMMTSVVSLYREVMGGNERQAVA